MERPESDDDGCRQGIARRERQRYFYRARARRICSFTAPAPGEYVFYCSIPGHAELGMHGTLVVK
ncbi:MAG: hypothetical protein DCC52_07570 [Chloroflexi bacterium]|nr:MAG: hypothetical protein DCC52_07570 [Chloroflexota bacterium]